MNKIRYLLGFINNILNFRISKFALVDNKSRFHKTSRLCHHSKFLKSKIGAYSYVGPRTHVVYADIGNFCSIASDCSIGLASHPIKTISTSPIFVSKKNATKYKWVEKSNFYEVQNVQIGSDVWIGTKVIIMGGVVIGNGAIIGAGSIVTKSIPDYAVAVGVPARVIKFRFDEDIICELKKINWWNIPEIILKEKISIFQIDNFSTNDLKEFENYKNENFNNNNSL